MNPYPDIAQDQGYDADGSPVQMLNVFWLSAKFGDSCVAKAVDAVATSIKEFGFRQPIVVNAEGVIVCGHTRFQHAYFRALVRHRNRPF